MLEGFHAVKHALRFGAELQEIVTRDAAALERLAERLGPDIAPRLMTEAREVDAELFEQLVPLAPATGVLALAVRPPVTAAGPREVPPARKMATPRPTACSGT